MNRDQFAKYQLKPHKANKTNASTTNTVMEVRVIGRAELAAVSNPSVWVGEGKSLIGPYSGHAPYSASITRCAH